jgi:hypothetical protein
MKKLVSMLKRALGALVELERRTFLGERPRYNLK